MDHLWLRVWNYSYMRNPILQTCLRSYKAGLEVLLLAYAQTFILILSMRVNSVGSGKIVSLYRLAWTIVARTAKKNYWV